MPAPSSSAATASRRSAATLARAEGLDAHALSITLRLGNDPGG
jgi:histidinol dehydrogenase